MDLWFYDFNSFIRSFLKEKVMRFDVEILENHCRNAFKIAKDLQQDNPLYSKAVSQTVNLLYFLMVLCS